MNVDAAPKPARGRPRDPRCDAAIADAAIELVAELGYERTSVDAIATRAGVSKPTIYRRWSGEERAHRRRAPFAQVREGRLLGHRQPPR